MSTELNTVEWPPAYTIKRHRRARHVKLRASAQKGLEITVPYRFALKELPAILAEHQHWIMQRLNEISVQRQATLPDQIQFPVFNETWSVRYEKMAKRLSLFVRPDNEILLLGEIENKVDCQQLLMRWIKHEAKKRLPPLLTALSEKCHLPYASVAVRAQKSRWGSCGSDKSINLNLHLIFLPLELVQYVMIHELCHTKHLNHSISFWKLVERFLPDWRHHRRLLRQADQYLPAWLSLPV
jgi:predicted metal-dependent hydrolase